MTASQLLARIKKSGAPPVLLLLGPEAHQRRQVKQALTATVGESAVTQHDLSQEALVEVLDDARSLSLFAAERLLWISNAEGALPRGRAAEESGEDETGGGSKSASGTGPLQAYVQDPTPGTVLVFEAARYDFDGDEKRQSERVAKFYSAIPDVVELRRFAPHEARREAESLASRAGLRIDAEALDLMVDALGADLMRLAVETEKLALYAGGRALSVDEIAELVPEARASSIFALVNALGRRDRARALEILDTLTRGGEYLPLALAFLSTQFRFALVASEAGLKSSQQIQGHFSRLGVPMWSSRAEQISQTCAKFGKTRIERALKLIFEADRGLRDARPDDRTIMERFILQLVA
jgi:DNA polymerase-3 subunit delta